MYFSLSSINDSNDDAKRLTKLLNPERITLIKYAHIPNRRKHMNMIREEDFPNPNDLPYMFVESTKSLIDISIDGENKIGSCSS